MEAIAKEVQGACVADKARRRRRPQPEAVFASWL